MPSASALSWRCSTPGLTTGSKVGFGTIVCMTLPNSRRVFLPSFTHRTKPRTSSVAVAGEAVLALVVVVVRVDQLVVHRVLPLVVAGSALDAIFAPRTGGRRRARWAGPGTRARAGQGARPDRLTSSRATRRRVSRIAPAAAPPIAATASHAATSDRDARIPKPIGPTM